MAKKYTRPDPPLGNAIPVNGDGDASGHTEPIDGAAIPRDVAHDLPSADALLHADEPSEAEAFIAATDAEFEAMAADLGALHASSSALMIAPPCPYCTSTTTERITPQLTECMTCEAVARVGDDPARLFTSDTIVKHHVAVFGPWRSGLRRRHIIARDYACHTVTGLVRLADRLGYTVDEHSASTLTFTRSVQRAGHED